MADVCPHCGNGLLINGSLPPALPQDVAAHLEKLEKLAVWADESQHKKWNGKAGIPVHGFSGEGKVIRAAASLILSQSSTIASAREVIEPLVEALQQMIANSEVDGKTYRDCHKKAVAALRAARDWKER